MARNSASTQIIDTRESVPKKKIQSPVNLGWERSEEESHPLTETHPPSLSALSFPFKYLFTSFPSFQSKFLSLSLSLSLSHKLSSLSAQKAKKPTTKKSFKQRKMAARVDLDGKPIKPLTICMIGAGGFIGSHLCEKLMAETPHKVLGLDVYSDKIKHLLEPAGAHPWSDRIQFHRLNIKNDSRLEGLIKMSDLVSSTPLSLHYHFRFSQFLRSFFETVLEFLS